MSTPASYDHKHPAGIILLVSHHARVFKWILDLLTLSESLVGG